MRQKNVKMIMCTVTAVLAFSSVNLRAEAATDLASVLPSAGVDYTLQTDATSLKNIKEEAETSVTEGETQTVDIQPEAVPGDAVPSDGSQQTENLIAAVQAEMPAMDTTATADEKVIEETKEVDISNLDAKILKDVAKKLDRKDEEESFKNLVIAKVNDYVNVRSIPSEDGEIVGKLYDKSVGSFISETNGWYEIKSGSVTGLSGLCHSLYLR